MKYKEIKYTTNFLTEVIVRIDFLSDFNSDPNSINPELSRAIIKHFPHAEPQTIVQPKISIEDNNLIPQTQLTTWKFWSKDQQHSFFVIHNAIFMTFNTYNTYEEFISPFLDIYNQFSGIYPDAQIKRLGMRYINNINVRGKNPLLWTSYIDSKLLCGIKFIDDDKEYLSRYFNTIDFNYPNHFLRIKYGIHNPDYPSPIKKKIFVIDLDAYLVESKRPEEVPSTFDQFHSSIQESFESMILDKLREIMS